MLVVAVRAVDDHLRNRGQLLFSGGQVPFGLVDDEHVLLLGCLLGLVSWVRPPFRCPLQDAHLVVFAIVKKNTVPKILPNISKYAIWRLAAMCAHS